MLKKAMKISLIISIICLLLIGIAIILGEIAENIYLDNHKKSFELVPHESRKIWNF